MKKLTQAILAIIVVFAFSPAYAQSIKVGFFGPLTGDFQHYGQSARAGVEIAISHFQETSHISIELIPQDTQLKPELAISAVQKLVWEEVAGIVCADGRGSLTAIGPILEDENIPTISTTTGRTIPEFNIYFYLCASDRKEKMFELVKNTITESNMRIDNVYIDFSSPNIRSASNFTNVELLDHSHTELTVIPKLDSKIILTQENTLYITYNQENRSLYASYKGFPNIRPRNISSNIRPGRTPILSGYAALPNQLRYFITGSVDTSREEFQSFVHRYRAMTNEETPPIEAVRAYDATLALLFAISETGFSSDRQQISDALKNTDFIGASGRIRFNGGRENTVGLDVFTIDDDTVVLWPNPCNVCTCEENDDEDDDCPESCHCD